MMIYICVILTLATFGIWSVSAMLASISEHLGADDGEEDDE